MDIKMNDLPKVILARFILKNYFEIKKENVSEEIVKEAIERNHLTQPVVVLGGGGGGGRGARGHWTQPLSRNNYSSTQVNEREAKKSDKLIPNTDQLIPNTLIEK